MKDYQQMDLFSKTPPKPQDDERIVKMERGNAYMHHRDFPTDYKLTFDVNVIAYETDLETGNEVVKDTMKQRLYMTWDEVQKYALQITDKWSKVYDHIHVYAELMPLGILEYFGD